MRPRARHWSRRDSLTLAFELDPRARWHDGTPVTARDVIFAFSRARDPKVDAQKALLLRYVAEVQAEGDRTVTGRGSSTDIIEASAKAYINALNRAWSPKAGRAHPQQI